MPCQISWTLSFRGRRSRNKVSVGEPAEGSFAWKHSTQWIMKYCFGLCIAECWSFKQEGSMIVASVCVLIAVAFCLSPSRFKNCWTNSAMDALVQMTMKDIVKCKKHCDLQISVNHLVVECGLYIWVTPECMSSSLLSVVHGCLRTPLLQMRLVLWMCINRLQTQWCCYVLQMCPMPTLTLTWCETR